MKLRLLDIFDLEFSALICSKSTSLILGFFFFCMLNNSFFHNSDWNTQFFLLTSQCIFCNSTKCAFRIPLYIMNNIELVYHFLQRLFYKQNEALIHYVLKLGFSLKITTLCYHQQTVSFVFGVFQPRVVKLPKVCKSEQTANEYCILWGNAGKFNLI